MEPRTNNPIAATLQDEDDREAIRVMIVDDSLTVRTIFARMVEDESGLQLAGTFSNAERAITKLAEVAPDVIMLDLEMPGMGGLEALPKMLDRAQNAQVLVVSSLTQDGAEHTLAALSIGAADTMVKPRPGGFDNEYRASLLDKIRALGGKFHPKPAEREKQESRPPLAVPSILRRKRPELVAIGASTGGIHSLNLLLRELPPTFDLPILVTQHLPSSFMSVFARQLEVASARRAIVAENGTEICKGEIIIAPGDGHLNVERKGEKLFCRISNEKSLSGCMPSVDIMLESLADQLGSRALAVVLSGMGRDGADGASALASAGGTIFAQDAETSAVWGMPGSVAKAGLATAIEPPERLAIEILNAHGTRPWK